MWQFKRLAKQTSWELVKIGRLLGERSRIYNPIIKIKLPLKKMTCI